MATRVRGAKRSIDGQGGSSFVFAPNVDLNAVAGLAVGGPPPIGASGNVADAPNTTSFTAQPTDNLADGSMGMPVSAGNTPGSGKKNDRRHRCHMCGKLFNRPSSLKIHLTTHTGERPFPCPFPGCGRAFNVSSNMRRHFRTHNSGAPGAEIAPAGCAPPASTLSYPAQQDQQQQQQQPSQQPPAWNVNVYNPGAGGQPIPRARGKRAKAGGGDNQSGNDGEANEGVESDAGRSQQQSLHGYPPFPGPGGYPGFPPPLVNIPGLPGMHDISSLPPEMQHLHGVPMGVQMMPIEMAFPVDPALTGQNAEGEADADAEGDEDGDEDADGENEGDGDAEGSNRPQLTHSTSNTRASNNVAPASKTRSSARVQAKTKSAGSASTPGAPRGRGRPPKASTATQGGGSAGGNANAAQQQQQQLQFRQILVPVSVPLTGDPAQAARLAQQYQQQYAQQYAKYAQYAQFYMQQQQAQAQAQGHGQAGQSGQSGGTPVHQSVMTQLPIPPPPGIPQQTLSDLAIPRPGPATSAERTTPSGAQGEPLARSVFVHWGPKEAKDKAEATQVHQQGGQLQQDVSAMQALADSAAEAAKANEAAKRKAVTTGESKEESLCANVILTGDETGVEEEQVKELLQEEAEARGKHQSDEAGVGEGDTEQAMDFDEAGDGEGEEGSETKPGSPSSLRKKRRAGRGRGRGRR